MGTSPHAPCHGKRARRAFRLLRRSCCLNPTPPAATLAQALLGGMLLQLQHLLDAHPPCLLLVGLPAGPAGRWPVLYANTAWRGLTGAPRCARRRVACRRVRNTPLLRAAAMPASADAVRGDVPSLPCFRPTCPLAHTACNG
jgi:hypothetical protein